MDHIEFVENLRKTMADAVALAEKIADETKKIREIAIDEANMADQLVRDWEFEAQKKAAQWVDQNRAQLKAEIRENLLLTVARKLMNSGEQAQEVSILLDLPIEKIQNLHHG